MTRGRIAGVIAVFVMVVSACHESPFVSPAPESMHADFMPRELMIDLRVQEFQTPPIVHPWRLGSGWERPTPDGVWAVGRSAELEVVVQPGVRSIWIE